MPSNQEGRFLITSCCRHLAGAGALPASACVSALGCAGDCGSLLHPGQKGADRERGQHSASGGAGADRLEGREAALFCRCRCRGSVPLRMSLCTEITPSSGSSWLSSPGRAERRGPGRLGEGRGETEGRQTRGMWSKEGGGGGHRILSHPETPKDLEPV